jgi:hypothetical protein
MFGKTNQQILAAFMLRNSTDYGLRVYASKISLTQVNVSSKNNVLGADSVKNVPLKGTKTPAIPNNKPNLELKK